MRGLSIQKITAASFVLHITVLALSVLFIKYSNKLITPLPYTVILVYPEKSGSSGTAVSSSRASHNQPTESRSHEQEKPVKKSTMIDTNKRNDQKILDDRIAELTSKAKVKRRVELRSVISVKGGNAKSVASTSEKEAATGTLKGALYDNYYGKITAEIWAEWVYPEMGKKDLEAVVSVTIRRDGRIAINGIEKSSGDIFFDRSVLKAIEKASPVTPPPAEVEIGIRFYP